MKQRKFVTSDWHFGEDRFKIMQRPFSSTEEHVDTIIKNHNSLVSPNDFVYVVGDVLYQNANPDIWLPKLAEMNGQKILIRGNHDRPFSNDLFRPYFIDIIPEGEGILLDEPMKLYLTHYPSQGRSDAFNLVGHIHGAWKVQLNSLNIGIDVHHFYPVTLDDIEFYFHAISQFYDMDVWAAYLPVNEQFQGQRGKQSTYFS